jgi:hypothetical protein
VAKAHAALDHPIVHAAVVYEPNLDDVIVMEDLIARDPYG